MVFDMLLWWVLLQANPCKGGRAAVHQHAFCRSGSLLQITSFYSPLLFTTQVMWQFYNMMCLYLNWNRDQVRISLVITLALSLYIVIWWNVTLSSVLARCDRTATTPVSDASTSTPNCLAGSGCAVLWWTVASPKTQWDHREITHSSWVMYCVTSGSFLRLTRSPLWCLLPWFTYLLAYSFANLPFGILI